MATATSATPPPGPAGSQAPEQLFDKQVAHEIRMLNIKFSSAIEESTQEARKSITQATARA